MRVLRRPRFLLDLAEELTWLNEKAGPEVAEAWYSSFKETIRQLERHPHFGRQRKDLLPPTIRFLASVTISSVAAFYEVTPKNLVLYRVRQGTMNLTAVQMKS